MAALLDKVDDVNAAAVIPAVRPALADAAPETTIPAALVLLRATEPCVTPAVKPVSAVRVA